MYNITKMPAVTYSYNKVHIYNWREKNIERNRAINRKSEQKRYAWKKIQKEFLAILRED